MNSRLTSFTVGKLALAANCKVETVRYYEKTGLMPEPPRTEGGHRLYSSSHAKRLSFIRRCRELGFTIQQVKELLKFIDEPHHTCGEVKALTMQQARGAQEKIDDLKRLQKALHTMASKCRGGRYTIDNCPIIDALYERH